jgi:hypothetical protein
MSAQVCSRRIKTRHFLPWLRGDGGAYLARPSETLQLNLRAQYDVLFWQAHKTASDVSSGAEEHAATKGQGLV